jgi:hypothetical protein
MAWARCKDGSVDLLAQHILEALVDSDPEGVVLEIDATDAKEDAEISADGTELYFISMRAGLGNYDIWVATRTCLD